ncbi:MAG: AcrR family transcriptional regulator [Alcanivorax sp.]|jgi:AcrR family transcriptional regulator
MLKTEQETVRAPRKERRDPRGDKRRRRILKSLHDCILENGYTRTTLLDIAQGADMTPSHLLYYFNGKEDLLGQYFENVSIRFMKQLDDLGPLDTLGQIHGLTDFWFKGEASSRKEIGFMLECFGAAVNEEVLRGTKAEFDMRCKTFLSEIFVSSPDVFMGNAKASAELSYALMIGLRSAVYFDDDVDLEDAHGLFLSSMLRMCGLHKQP